MRTVTSPGINPPFDRLFRCPRYVTCFVLSLTPLVLTRSYDQVRLVRLACLNHAASVRSEPGSNSSLGKLCHKTRLIATGESVTCVFQHTTWPSRPLPAGTTYPPVARRPRAPAFGTHSRFAWARTVHLTKNDRALHSREGKDYTKTQGPVNRPPHFLFFPDPGGMNSTRGRRASRLAPTQPSQ